MRVGKHFLPEGGYECPQSARGEQLILRCWGVSWSDRDNRPFCLVVEMGKARPGEAWGTEQASRSLIALVLCANT